jgi:hypothetical protein
MITKKKLTFHPETLRKLTNDELGQVGGAMNVSDGVPLPGVGSYIPCSALGCNLTVGCTPGCITPGCIKFVTTIRTIPISAPPNLFPTQGCSRFRPCGVAGEPGHGPTNPNV